MDMNNDGRMDLLVADMAATTREKDHRGMAKLRAGLTEDLARPEAALRHIARVLKLTAGNKSEAAKILGVTRKTLQRKGF